MKKEKTIQELVKEFPNKSYRELEKYRDADRVEEAIGIGHNHPPEEEQAGVCIMGEMRKDREEDPKDKIKELEEALANALAVNESHQKMNGKLQERLTELEEENKKGHDTLDEKLASARKAGL